jgi:hypothetical protein
VESHPGPSRSQWRHLRVVGSAQILYVSLTLSPPSSTLSSSLQDQIFREPTYVICVEYSTLFSDPPYSVEEPATFVRSSPSCCGVHHVMDGSMRTIRLDQVSTGTRVRHDGPTVRQYILMYVIFSKKAASRE